MSELNDVDQKILALERQARELQNVKAEQARRDARQREAAMTASGIPRPFASDDYAGFNAGRFSAYYGYEHTICTRHGSKAACDAADCEDGEWAFVIRLDKKVIAEFAHSEMNVQTHWNVQNCLIAGLALCLSRGILVQPTHPDDDQTEETP